MTQNAKPKDNFTRYLVIGVVVLVVAIMLVPTVLSKTGSSAPSAIPSTVNADNGYGITFNKELTGVPTVDIYEDFQCPICQQFEGVNMKYIDSIITEKKAIVTFHVLSFLGQESVRAANASACAADAGKFVSFHNTLYANQPKTENSGEWSDDRIIAIAKVAGITGAKFENCVKNSTYQSWVEKVAEAGSKAGVNATPTVFVNGKEINRQTDYFDTAKFQAAVEG